MSNLLDMSREGLVDLKKFYPYNKDNDHVM